MISPTTWREVTGTSVMLARDLLQTVMQQRDFGSVAAAIAADLPSIHPALLLGLNSGAEWENGTPAERARMEVLCAEWVTAVPPEHRVNLLDQLLQELTRSGATPDGRMLVQRQIEVLCDLGVPTEQIPRFAQVVLRVADNPLHASTLQCLLREERGWAVLARQIEHVQAIGTLDRLLAATLRGTPEALRAERGSPVLTCCLAMARDMMGSNGWLYVAGRLLCAGVPLEDEQRLLMRTPCFQATNGKTYTLPGAFVVNRGAFSENQWKEQVTATFAALREAGFDLDADDAGDGASALTLAMRECIPATAHVLLDFGCDPRAVPEAGREARSRFTALELAQQWRVAAEGKAQEPAANALYDAMRASAARAAAGDAMRNNVVASRKERIAMLDAPRPPARRPSGPTA